MTTTDIDAEIALMRTVAFIEHLADDGALTRGEARKVLAAVLGRSKTVVGSLMLRVRLDEQRV